MAIPWATNLFHFHLNKLFKKMVSNLTLFCLATFVGFDILFDNLFGYFQKNWAIFSKTSGHPAPA